jgi:hypothetical protein
MGCAPKLNQPSFVQLCVHLPPPLVRKAKLMAAERGLPLKDLVRQALKRYLHDECGAGEDQA